MFETDVCLRPLEIDIDDIGFQFPAFSPPTESERVRRPLVP